jgi:hypothetical protein
MFAYSNMTFDLDACDGFMGATPVPVGGPTVVNPTTPWGTNRASNFKSGTVRASNLPIHRVTVKRLPTINPYPFNVIQPLKGASSATCPVL